jgi:hypothetical protein
MTKQIILSVAALLLILPALGAAQSSKPINVALFDPIQIFPEDNSITGVRLNLIYGKNVAMTGIDLGLVNAVGSGEFQGLQWGLINLDDGKATGIQWGGVNIPNGEFTGLEVGWVNFANSNVEGVQYGFVNKGGHVHGLQLGFVNYAESMKGLQIGFINVIKTGGEFPVFPIVNWSF